MDPFKIARVFLHERDYKTTKESAVSTTFVIDCLAKLEIIRNIFEKVCYQYNYRQIDYATD